MSGYVYFIQSSSTNKIKIGFSKNVARRLKQLQTGNSGKLFLVGYIPGSMNDEMFLHNYFSGKRTNGEWFKIDDYLIQKVSKIILYQDIHLGIQMAGKVKNKVHRLSVVNMDDLISNASKILKSDNSPSMKRSIESQLRREHACSRRVAREIVSKASPSLKLYTKGHDILPAQKDERYTAHSSEYRQLPKVELKEIKITSFPEYKPTFIKE